MKISECCGAKLTNYDKNWDDGICIECKEHSPAINEEVKELRMEIQK